MPLSTPAPTASGLYQCASCRRRYKRADHLTRHVRTHLQSKPHQCDICPKNFTRIDLLRRHVAGHEAKGEHRLAHSNLAKTAFTSRVSQACHSCAANHLRCSEKKPCDRCLSKGIDCVWEHAGLGCYHDTASTPPGTASQAEDVFSSPGSQQGLVAQKSEHASYGGTPQISSSSDATPGEWDTMSPGQSESVFTCHLPQTVQGSLPTLKAGVAALSIDPMSQFPDTFSGSYFATPFAPFQMDLDTSMDLDDMDLQFLDSYNANIPFYTEQLTFSVAESQQMHQGSPTPIPTNVSTDAFRFSQWSFRPTANDHGAAEEHNLSIPTPNNYGSPDSVISMNTRVVPTRLSTAGRDGILSIVLQNCSTDSIVKAVASFPSVDLLDSLIQFYLSSNTSHARTFIHAPTYDPNRQRPELTTALVAHGAVLTQDPTLTKLGFALQESLRKAVPRLWESRNTFIRDLEVNQCAFILLEIGLWSGHSRKMEIAESFLQPTITMLRRGGMFKKTAYPDPEVAGDQTAELLDRAWRAWVEQESFRRLCLRLLLHDSDASLCLSVSPIMSYAELALPMKATDDLWNAETSADWKRIYLSQNKDMANLEIADYFDDPGLLNEVRHRQDALDIGHMFLSCAWRIVWELTQTRSAQRRAPRRWSKLLVMSRMEEVSKTLGHFRLSAEPTLLTSPEMMMALESLSLHLAASIEDVQVLAGIEGPQQSRNMVTCIRAWVNDESSRRAVCHAGQVLRCARMIQNRCLQGPSAMMLYHAGLVLWSYGLFSAERMSPSRQTPAVLLDDVADSVAVQRFAQLGSGTPCITRFWSESGTLANDAVPLTSTDGVMKAIEVTLRSGFEGGSRPLLVDKLLQIVEGLRNPSRGANVCNL